jgi:hypothetical protein
MAAAAQAGASFAPASGGPVVSSGPPGARSQLSPISPRVSTDFRPPVGWLVAVNGPAFGQDFTLRPGFNFLVMTPATGVVVADTCRPDAQAVIEYDAPDNRFSVRAAGRTLPYLNGRILETNAALQERDRITMGDTTVVFMPLAGNHFHWD